LSQPGSIANVVGRNKSFGASAGLAEAVAADEGSGAFTGATVVHAETVSTAIADTSKLRRVNDIEDIEMWWVFVLEAGAALFMLVFIVWWTMFAGRNTSSPAKPKQQDDDTQA
jgi:hypothetical protein